MLFYRYTFCQSQEIAIAIIKKIGSKLIIILSMLPILLYSVITPLSIGEGLVVKLFQLLLLQQYHIFYMWSVWEHVDRLNGCHLI